MKRVVIAGGCACVLWFGLLGNAIAAKKETGLSMSREQARKECFAQAPGRSPQLAMIHHQCIMEKIHGR
jgi:hypothetical protein